MIKNSGASGNKSVANFGAAGATLTISNANNYGFDGVITNGANVLNLVKDGAGQLTLGGTGIVYTGQTTVRNGTLALTNTTAYVSPTTINGGQLLLLSPTAAQLARATIARNTA